MEGHAERRLAEAEPPKILTNKHWPVRQKILCCLSLDDKRALGKAYPELKIQEDGKYKSQELVRATLVSQVETMSDSVIPSAALECDVMIPSHSHFCHPIINRIQEKKQSATTQGVDLAGKTQEVNQCITNISGHINKIAPIDTEQDAEGCWLEGYTALHIAAYLNDVETVRRLIEKGADMYRLGGLFEFNCLHACVFSDSIDVARFLITEMNMDKEQRAGGGGPTVLELLNDVQLQTPLGNFEEWIQLLEE